MENSWIKMVFDNHFASQTWNELVQAVENQKLRLSRHGAQELYSGMVEELAGETPPHSERGTVLLKGFLVILQNSRSMVKHLKAIGPSGFKRDIPLHSFFSGTEATNQLGYELAKVLIELCPGFGDWKSFIQFPPEEQQILETDLERNLGSITRAQSLPSLALLSELYRKKMTRSLAAKLSLPGEQETIQVEDTPFRFFSRTISTLHQKLHHHQEERQKEILEQAERLTMVTIHHTEMALNEAVEAQNQEETEKYQVERREGLQSLVSLHKTRRQRRAQRYQEKLSYIREAMPEAEKSGVKGLIEAFLSHENLHKEAVESLEQIYHVLEQAIPLVNPAEALKLIDGLIGELYAVSVSLAVAGPIGVGKSTIVNCVVGRNISPHRLDTMTAVPVRYVHDAGCDEPKMLVPFSDQLNKVLNMIRKTLNSDDKEWIRLFLEKIHLSDLLKEIDQGLEIKPTYEGTAEIMKASVQIHDLFRLAVNDVFEDSLMANLPLDWSQGLDTYLTVRVRFPGLEFLSGIVEFAIVDTPGINESGVQKLCLTKTIKDTLRSCKYAALVTTPIRFADESLTPLVNMFHEIKSQLKTPVMSIVSFSEQVLKKDEETLKSNIADTLVPESMEKIFTTDSIYVVSGLRKTLGSRMLSFLETSGRKPEPDATGPEQQLAEEWIHYAAFGDTLGDKMKYYQDLSLPELRTRSERLVETSNMNVPIHKMALEAISSGIPTSVNHALCKAFHELQPFFQKLSSKVSPEKLQEFYEQGALHLSRLASLQESLKQEVELRSFVLKKEIKRQGEQILKEMRSWKGPLTSITPTANPFLYTFRREVEMKGNQKALELLKSSKKVNFSSQKEAEEAVSALNGALRRSVEEHFMNLNRRIPQVIQEWSQTKKEMILRSYEEIGQVYTQNLGISLDSDILSSMAEFVEQGQRELESSLSFGVDPATQRIIKKKTRQNPTPLTLPFLLSQMKERKVKPEEVRHILEQRAEQSHIRSVSVLEAHVDKMVSQIMKPFVEDCLQDTIRLQNLLREKVTETQLLQKQTGEPLEATSRELEAALERSQNLVKTVS